MASVMLFPNVATHRRMPHLSKEPKETTTPKPTIDVSLQQRQQWTATVLPPHSSSSTPFASIDRTDNTISSSSIIVHTQKALASSSTSSLAAGKNLLTLSTSSTSHSSSNSKPIADGTSSSGSLLVDGTGGHSFLLSTPVGSVASTPLIDHQYDNGHQEQESSQLGHEHGQGHGRDHSDHSPLHLSLLHHKNQHHDRQQQQGHHPPSAPHGPSCISNTHHPLPLSGTTTSISCPSSSTSHESRLIKTALYDAFGCLYHPVQHTHAPSPCSPSGICNGQPGTSKTSMCAGGGGQAQAHALRSGEVTPLISPSPRAMSPILRPHLGLSSAPITPLELSSCSEDGISSSSSGGHGGGGAGYFGTAHGHSHGHGSGSGPSPSLGGGVAASSPSKQLHQHLSPNHYHPQPPHGIQGHGHGIHQHLLPPAPQHHPSLLLRRTGSFNKHNPHTKHQHDDSLLHTTHDPTTSDGATLLSRKSSLGDIHLDPIEHPVLCSLQTLSLTHPHPANHFHPHLGHDLGHDRVSISSSPPSDSHMATVLPLTPSGVLSKTRERS